MLTRKQHELLLYIHKHLGEHGVSPSFDEMKEALNLKSKSGIHRLISGLEERGFIRRLPHRARALEVLRLPGEPSGQAAAGAHAGTATSGAGAGSADPGSNVVQANFRAPTVPEPGGDGQSLHLPLFGRIDPAAIRLRSCRCSAGSQPARRSKRCGMKARSSRFRRRCWAMASITAWRSTAIP